MGGTRPRTYTPEQVRVMQEYTRIIMRWLDEQPVTYRQTRNADDSTTHTFTAPDEETLDLTPLFDGEG